MQDLSGRTAFITGGAQGIGLGIARRLAREGINLAIVDIDAAALEAAQSELENLTRVATHVLDVRNREAYALIADEVEENLGPVSLLFNNAGVAAAASVTKMTYDMWDWTLGVNLHGVVNGIQTFVPRMIRRGEAGHVVNTSSGAGLTATGAGFLYCTSKYAVVGMSEALRNELEAAGTGIGVSVLCPGPVATNIISHTIMTRPGATPREEMSQEALNRIKEKDNLLRQGVSIDEVGAMVLAGINKNSPYIFTDRFVESAVIERTERIIDCLPG
ncbi:SDR family NAD(P)-dependent oxidoreductase [Kineobactrum salinum]|uniref:SDR family NAD(P)-dependent oxidoreductase n=1 Tax=Kineobactrum salinum TaxID=2708301 RepID=A0A6C0U0U0_9GAMM|nr:SDR family NAD(P)-dependent oxidoreductase [Kineobactrum salinum]QIB65518.1 SDR family NAD(P)-dependent oxidoreductase [Kineobactrum salinum]